MRTSCIAHPPNDRLIIVRSWQIAFCNGNRAAAALLSFFEHWHNYKLTLVPKNKKSNDIAEMHGDKRHQDESLYQFHTFDELSDGIIGLYGKTTVIEAIQFLVELQVISIHNNPNPRYKFDKTKYYQFYPEVCNQWLAENYQRSEVCVSSIHVADEAQAVQNSTIKSEKLDSPVLEDGCRKTTIDNSKLIDRALETDRPSIETNRAITQITSQINKQIDRRDEFSEQSETQPSETELPAILELLQTGGIPLQQLMRPDDQHQLRELINTIQKKNQSPHAIFTAALQRALRAKQGQGLGVFYLVPIVRQLLVDAEKSKFTQSPYPQPKAIPTLEKNQSYFSPDCQSWLNEEGESNESN